MPKKSTSLGRGPLWILTRYRNNRMEVLTFDPEDGDGGFLAVFGFEDEAETFVRFLEDGEKRDWRSRETSSEELLSIFYGPCAGVRWVALDPLPLPFGRAILSSMSMKRELFVQALMGKGGRLSGELAPT